ncbi:hypothetical protein ANO11243_041670 [Dothideomycetidae sp. 11243]|nr:hypothetical protein ANO11243_041670 [fungal sp. No.11243]
MLSTRLPLRIAALAGPARQAPLRPLQFTARTVASRNVIVPTFARAYATPGKPKKGSVGATSTTRRAAASKTKKPAAAKKTTTAKKPKAKKPKAKKPKKVARKKPKTKTPEQLARAKARKQSAAVKAKAAKSTQHIKELKQLALKPPPLQGESAYIVFFKAKAANDNAHMKSIGVTNFVKEVASEYRALNASERESYERRGQEARASTKKAYEDWVTQHHPDEIRRANRARISLRRLKTPGNWNAIKDDRQLSQPASPFLLYLADVRNEFASHDVKEAAKAAGQRWKTLSESDKEKYVDEYNGAVQQYNKDYESLYGSPPPSSRKTSPA